MPASPNLTSQISYKVVALLPRTQSVCAVQMSFYGITADYNGPLEAAHAHIDDDRYDTVECGAAGQPKFDLSDQLQGCSIASTHAIRLRSALTMIDTMRWSVVMPASPTSTSQICYKVVALIPRMQSVCAVQMSFYGITADCNGPLEAAHAHIDNANLTSQISYKVVASLPRTQSDCAVQMSFNGITAVYNGPLEAAHAHIDDDRYDMAECGAAGQPNFDFSTRENPRR